MGCGLLLVLALLVLPFLLASLAFFHLPQLLGKVLFAHQPTRIVVLHLLTELLQFFANQSGLLLLGLCLFNLTDGIFYLAVGLFQ